MQKTMRIFSLFILFFNVITYCQSQSSAALYTVSTEGDDILHHYDFDNQTWAVVGETGTENLKALEFDNISKTLYGVDEGMFGIIDIATGMFTSYGLVNSAEGEYGTLVLDDIQDIAYDTETKVLYAVHRIPGNGPGTNDVLFQIDPKTGLIKKNAMKDSKASNAIDFFNGVDYVIIPAVYDSNGSGYGVDLYDVSGIDFIPHSSTLFIVQTQDSDTVISEIDKSDGTINAVIYDTPISFISDFCFAKNGLAYSIQTKYNTIETFDLAAGSSLSFTTIDPTGTYQNFQSLAGSFPINDLAVKMTLSPNQTLPITEEHDVTFDITIYNQGEVNVDEINLISYLSNDVYLDDLEWTLIGNNAYKVVQQTLAPGASITTTLQVEVKEGFEGTIRNAVEIASAFNSNNTDKLGNPIFMPDIDSFYNEKDNEDNILDDEINGDGLNEDEDDHDIVTFNVGTSNSNCDCFSVAQNKGAENELYQYDVIEGTWQKVGNTGTTDIKALTYIQSTNKLYGIEQGKLGIININTGKFTALGLVNSGEGSYGTITLDDIEGLAYDAQLEVLFAVHRIPGDGIGTNDILFQIDPATGLIVKNAMTNPATDNPADYVSIPAVFLGENLSVDSYDVYGITYDIYNNQLLALHAMEGDHQTIITELIKNTGEIYSILRDVQTDILKDITPNKNNQFFAIGINNNDVYADQLISLDLETGNYSSLGLIDPTGTAQDFKSLACQVPINDLALRIEHDKEIISLPYVISDDDIYDFVAVDFFIYNQGNIPIDEFSLNIYNIDLDALDSLEIIGKGWAWSNNIATKKFEQRIMPGRNYYFTVSFSVKENFEGLLKLSAEIESAYSYDITDEQGNPIALADIDSQYDNSNNEINIIDNEVNGGGKFLNEDEDDHDITYVRIVTNTILEASQNKLESPCYAIAHNNGEINTLSVYNPAENFWYIVDIIGTTGIKALAINHTNNLIYAIDDGILGTINTYSGNFTPIGTINTGNGDHGILTLDNIYGLTFDTSQGVLYASHRISGTNDSSNDLIFQIDPFTGSIIPNAMMDNLGNPADYAVVPSFVDHGVYLNYLRDVSDLTINPFTGKLYAAISKNNETNQLVEINKQSAAFESTILSWDDNDKLGAVTFISEHEIYTTLYQPDGETQLVLTNLQTQTNTRLGALDKFNTVTGFLSLDCSQFICVDEKNISETYQGQGVITSGIYQAGSTVNSDGIVNGNNQQVTYKAGVEINLEAGFEIKVGSEFSAEIEDCQ